MVRVKDTTTTERVKAEAILLLAKARGPALREKAAAILMMMMEKAVKVTTNILPRVPKDLKTLEKAAAIPKALKVKDTLERVKATSQPKSL
jgi:hypothetical protein